MPFELRIGRDAEAARLLERLAHAAEARRGGVDDEVDVLDRRVALAVVVGVAVDLAEVRDVQAHDDLERLLRQRDPRPALGADDRLRQRVVDHVAGVEQARAVLREG